MQEDSTISILSSAFSRCGIRNENFGLYNRHGGSFEIFSPGQKMPFSFLKPIKNYEANQLLKKGQICFFWGGDSKRLATLTSAGVQSWALAVFFCFFKNSPSPFSESVLFEKPTPGSFNENGKWKKNHFSLAENFKNSESAQQPCSTAGPTADWGRGCPCRGRWTAGAPSGAGTSRPGRSFQCKCCGVNPPKLF